MMAMCVCDNGHEFSTRVLEWSEDINVIVLEDEVCPHCEGEINFEIHALDSDDE